MGSLRTQGTIFGRHFLRHTPSAAVIEFYERAVKQSLPPLDVVDKQLLDFATAHRWSVGFIDAGLAFMKPQSEFRHRLYIMFAILESSHEYHDKFLPKQRNPFYFGYVLYVGARSIVKSAVGLVLVKVLV